MPEFGLAFGGCGGGGADGGGVGDVDARVPEAVAELPNLKFQRVWKRSELTQLSQALPEIGDDGLRRWFFGRAGFELFNDCFNLEEATVVRLRVSVERPELRRGYLCNSHFLAGNFERRVFPFWPLVVFFFLFQHICTIYLSF